MAPVERHRLLTGATPGKFYPQPIVARSYTSGMPLSPRQAKAWTPTSAWRFQPPVLCNSLHLLQTSLDSITNIVYYEIIEASVGWSMISLWILDCSLKGELNVQSDKTSFRGRGVWWLPEQAGEAARDLGVRVEEWRPALEDSAEISNAEPARAGAPH